ncbi:tRNA-splicing endonuclease subunit Sen54-like isoform X2 [Dreissena polymorpha]|nr:tRNA-splicing endonuclease subunit Sen54-like isoform X2 [Dreissena polymorpha]
MHSADELFRVRQGLEKSVPQKGGVKDFMPDGSWIQGKQIEKFHEEREKVLAEPRVQKKCDYVHGLWTNESRLVEIEHEGKSFWKNMGFTRNGRKFLHPEEALFLMEMNVLQVWYNFLPMSIEGAYCRFLGPTLTLEFHQVYAHLRRMGYVVIRHRGKLASRYEREIGLDKYQKKKERQLGDPMTSSLLTKKNSIEELAQMEGLENCVTDKMCEHEKVAGEEIVASENSQIKMDCAASIEKAHSQETEIGGNEEMGSSLILQSHMNSIKDSAECLNDNVTSLSPVDDNILTTFKHSDATNSAFSSESRNASGFQYKSSAWDFRKIAFPNFGAECGDVIKIQRSESNLTPGHVVCELDCYDFNRMAHINKKKDKKKDLERDRKLKFSNNNSRFSSYQNSRNWSEYKVCLYNWRSNNWRQDQFPHLFADGLQPLVRPELATSTEAILQQLQVIKSSTKPPRNSKADPPAVLPHFDVYSPNKKFKKTNPGTPDFRVIVMRCDESPPDLKTISDIDVYFDDDVPLHCAVVDAGTVMFNTLSFFTLPTEVSLG